MQITHLIPTLDPDHGGVPAAALRLAAGQAGLGNSVQLVDFLPPRDVEAVDRSLKPIPHIDQIRLIRCKVGQEVHSSASAIEIGEASDLVHFHGVWVPSYVPVAARLRRRGVPYVFTPHGMLDPWSLRQKWLKKWLALRLYGKKMLDHSAFIHVLNDEEADLLAPLNLHCPLKIVSNGVFFEEIEPLPNPGEFYRQHPKLDGAPYILFLSRLHYKKGLDVLAESFIKLTASDQETHLVVVGPDDGEGEGFLARVEAAGLEDRVHIIGPLYGNTKYQALRDASCFCLPSRQEGFSLAITEALACGVPTVITHGCHFPEVASSGAGRVVGLDSGEVAAALVEVLGSTKLRKSMSTAGRGLVAERYTWGRVAEQMLRHYAAA